MSTGNGTVRDYWAETRPQKGFFDLFRTGQYPTLYDSNKTPVTSDVLEAGFIFAGAILAFSLLLILPGIRSGDRISALIRILVGVFVLTSIMICNFGQEWEVAELRTKTPYRAGLNREINATIGVKIGLRSVNITLKGDPVVQVFKRGRVNETINYNERISWDNRGWLVGRLGFGPYAGRFNQEFREQQRRGAPFPILWVAEYFTLDGEGVRWGRHYLQAGYFAHIMLWTALPLWLLSLILYKMVIRYGAYFTLLTGLSMLISNIIFAAVRNPFQLRIPFEDGFLEFHWGPTFWLCIFTGLLCSVIGLVVIILDHVMQESLSEFFGVDITQELEEFYVEPSDASDDVADSKWLKRKTKKSTIILRSRNAEAAAPLTPTQIVVSGMEEGDIEMQAPSLSPTRGYQRNEAEVVQRGYRRRTLFPTTKKSQKNRPRPPPVPDKPTGHDNPTFA